MTENVKTIGQDVTTIFPAQRALLRNANVVLTYSNRDAKATIFPTPSTIDASVFVDQPQPTVGFKEVRRETLESPTLAVDEKKKEDNAKEQKVQKEDEKRDKGRKISSETNDFCTSKTCGEKKDRRGTCVKKSTRREMLEEDISPMKLTEMISNSIKEAVQTIVKQCSMEEEKTFCPHWKESEKALSACRAHIPKGRCKTVFDTYHNREKTCRIPRQYNNLPTYSNPHSYSRTHKDTTLLPMKNKVNNDRKIKKNSKPTSNMNTDNRRMTGNVNIYICSETNDKDQENFKKKLKSQISDTSSDSTTGQLNSRCVSASSVSSCKLINSIQEKRKRKLQAHQSPNSIQDNQKGKMGDNSDNNAVYDNEICSRKSNEFCKERTDSRITDEDIGCEDTISSTRDGYYCEDASGMDFQRQDSPDFVLPCSSLDACGNSKQSRSWTTIYPSGVKTRLDDNDVPSSNTICIDRRSYHKNDDRSKDVCKNDNEYTVCRPIDDNNWLPKSIYTDCSMNGKIDKECFTNDRKYRNKKLQVSPLNRNIVRMKKMGHKSTLETSGSCQKKHVARQWSTCSCIVEEEEDYCTNVDTTEQKLSENLCDVTERVEKISVCRTPSSESAKNATVCVTSFKGTGELFEKTQTYKSIFRDLVECRRSTTVCATTLGNTEESTEVTRVCKEFVAEEPRQDITVCRAIFAEPKESPKEKTVCKTELSDFKETPKEIICKVHDSNFVVQDDVNEIISLNDTKDKLAKEKADNNLNGQKENVINLEEAAVQSDDKYNNAISTNIIENNTAKDTKQNEQIAKTTLNNQSKIRVPSVGQIKDSKLLSKNIYSIISPRVEYNRNLNFLLNRNVKEAPKTFDDQQRRRRTQLSPSHQFTKSNSQQSNIISKDLAMQNFVYNNQAKEKISRDEKENISNKTEVIQEKDTVLHRSFRRLIDVIRRRKMQYKDKIETEKSEPKAKIITNNRLNTMKSRSVVQIENKFSDEKNNQNVNKKVHPPMRSHFAGKQETNGNVVHVKKLKPIVRADDFTEEGKKIDISDTIQATRLKPKLLRIIATKKMYLQRAEATAKTQDTEAESAPVEITINEETDQEEISQELIPAKAAEEIKTERPIASEISIDEIKDVRKDIIDVSKDIANKSLDTNDKKALRDITGKAMECNVTSPQRKLKKERAELISCTCGASIDPSKFCPCVLPKCIKCNKTPEDCPYTNNRFRQEEVCCAHRYSSTRQCACTATQYLKACLKTDKPKFRSISLSNDAYICTNHCGRREECKCRNIAASLRRSGDECRCRMCETCSNCLKSVNKCVCRPTTNCVNCCRPWDECCCVTSASVKRHKIKRDRRSKKAMICLYCDNPQDKCTCRASIGKCSCCGMLSDVCDYQDDESYGRDRERVIERSNENRTIQVTSCKPKEKIRRYFARNHVDHRSDDNEKYRCEKTKRQCPEELPYQRLNVFSDVMNELQLTMSESVCCARCRRNPYTRRSR